MLRTVLFATLTTTFVSPVYAEESEPSQHCKNVQLIQQCTTTPLKERWMQLFVSMLRNGLEIPRKIYSRPMDSNWRPAGKEEELQGDIDFMENLCLPTG